MNRTKAENYLHDFLKDYIDISEEKLSDIISKLPLKEFKKGSMILYQGEASKYCMFVISGCLRQYRINEEGNEVTSEFYEEGQWVNVFNESVKDNVSKYSVVCSEDSLLIYSEAERKSDMFKLFPSLIDMTSSMLTEKIGQVNESNYAFAALSPEERVKSLITNRPTLLKRVPQHQLASYLGITPEAFSRIKKRLESLI
jgi:CRP-like cAMP-binding protein